jgi:cytochrome b involved in lipid metabolism
MAGLGSAVGVFAAGAYCAEARTESIVVTLHGKRYDLTSFAKIHPGGERVLREMNGHVIDDMWAQWPFHYMSPYAAEILR